MILPTNAWNKRKKLKEPKFKKRKKNAQTLYFEIIQAIDEGLTKPSKVEDIPKYLEELEKRAKVEKGDSSISEPEKEEIKK